MRLRPVADVLVKGKTEPVRIHTPDPGNPGHTLDGSVRSLDKL